MSEHRMVTVALVVGLVIGSVGIRTAVWSKSCGSDVRMSEGRYAELCRESLP